MSLTTEQALEYIKCVKDLNALSALMIEAGTGDKSCSLEISAQAAKTLYLLLKISMDFLDDDKMKEVILLSLKEDE